MKVLDPNYEPPEQTYTKYPDGSYRFKGFEWTSKTGEGRPCVKPQKNAKMTGRLRWILEDGKQGPTQNLELFQMALLRNLYGLPEAKIPELSNAGAVSKYMEDLVNASTKKVIEATVNDGWVNIKGLDVPRGMFRFYLSRVSELRDGEYGKYFYVDFTITGGEGGAPTPYKGMIFTEIYNYAVQVVNGKPQWELSPEKGQPTANASRLSTLIRLTAPEYASQDISPADPYNILPEWVEEALSARKGLKGTRGEIVNKDGKKRIGLILQTLESSYDDQHFQSEPETPKPSTNGNSSADSPKDILINLMTDKMGGPSFVADRLTDLGKKFAKQYLVPLKDKGLIVNTSFILLTDEEVYEIIKLVVKGSEELGIKEDFIYEGDLERVQKLLNKEYTIIKDGDPNDVPEELLEKEEENPFS